MVLQNHIYYYSYQKNKHLYEKLIYASTTKNENLEILNGPGRMAVGGICGHTQILH